jgi:hypothetical protein
VKQGDHWITYVARQALANDMLPFWWDAVSALERANCTVKDQRTLDALVAGGGCNIPRLKTQYFYKQ